MMQQFKDIKKLHWAIIFTVLFAAVFVAFYMLFYTARVKENDVLREDIAKKTASLRDIKHTLEVTEKLKQENAKLKQKIQYVEGEIPTEKYIPTLLFQIEQLTMSTGMQLRRIAPSEVKEGGQVFAPVSAGERKPAAGGSSARQLPPSGIGRSVWLSAAQDPEEQAAAEEKKTAEEKKGAEGAGAPAAGADAAETANQTAADYLNDYERIGFIMELSGTYNNLILFLRELAVFPKMVVVDKINLTAGAEKSAAASTTSKKPKTNDEGKVKEEESDLSVLLSVIFFKPKKTEG